MRKKRARVYVYWVDLPGDMLWRAYFKGQELWIRKTPQGFIVTDSGGLSMTEKPFPSLKLAKCAGSMWLRREQAKGGRRKAG